ncbi:MAG: TetR family transcriptional regulator [Rhodobacteraceae bacterium]|nr:TetR family transcriptional regulator [Paracoccaceae bacterium]
MSSLRARQRQQTESAIRQAAVNLASEHGLDNVTTEMISAAAGVSPRTFFNYFSYKDAAFLPPKIEWTDVDAEKFIRSTKQLHCDFLDLLKPMFKDIGIDRSLVKKSYEIAINNQKLMSLRTSAFHEFEERSAKLIEKRLAYKEITGDAHLMAALILAAIRKGFEAWVTGKETSVLDVITAKVEAIPTLFHA